MQLFPDGYANGRWLPGNRVMTFGGVEPGTQAGIQVTEAGQISVILPGAIAVSDAIAIPRGQVEDIRLIARDASGTTPLQVFDFDSLRG